METLIRVKDRHKGTVSSRDGTTITMKEIFAIAVARKTTIQLDVHTRINQGTNGLSTLQDNITKIKQTPATIQDHRDATMMMIQAKLLLHRQDFQGRHQEGMEAVETIKIQVFHRGTIYFKPHIFTKEENKPICWTKLYWIRHHHSIYLPTRTYLDQWRPPRNRLQC